MIPILHQLVEVTKACQDTVRSSSKDMELAMQLSTLAVLRAEETKDEASINAAKHTESIIKSAVASSKLSDDFSKMGLEMSNDIWKMIINDQSSKNI